MKPDYSIIKPIACKCGSIEERDEILRQLKEWGVPRHDSWCVIDTDIIISWENEALITFTSIRASSVSPSDFLSKFREVYDKWRSTEGLVHIEKAPVTDKGIVFPSDDDIDLYIMKDAAECPRKRAFEWYKSEIIRLNPHLKV